jgi:hypothetical protein
MVRKPKGRGLYQKPKEQQEQCPAAQGQFNKRRNYSQRVVFLKKPRMNTNFKQLHVENGARVLSARNTLSQRERAGQGRGRKKTIFEKL